jgi:hypothetical protein
MMMESVDEVAILMGHHIIETVKKIFKSSGFKLEL